MKKRLLLIYPILVILSCLRGALLAFMGVESFADITDKFEPVVPSETIFKEDITLHNIPFGGLLYTIQSKDGILTINMQK